MSTFYEQLGGVAGVFEQWGACERTVVACALARRVPLPGLRLLHRAVEAALGQGPADDRLERDANDPQLLAALLAAAADTDDDEGGDHLQQLLTMLPLLRTDNERAKDVYVSAAPSLVQRCVDAPRRPSAAPDLCRQLLSYLLVHPALTHNDQRTLTQWLRYLENHISGRNTETLWQQRIDPSLLPDNNIWGANGTFRRTIGKNVEFRGIGDPLESYSTDFLQESFSKNGRDVEISLEGEKLNFDVAISQPKSQRSNSLTPPSTNFMQTSSSAENLSDEPFQKPRSFSLSSEHSLTQLRPIGVTYGTTGSETRLDSLRAAGPAPAAGGMSTVAHWLKTLRLHKYVWLFTNISYDQMMAIDEGYLEKLGVTKGARHKILVSIKKLNEREAVLTGVEAELAASSVSPTVVSRALERVRGVLLSPMPPQSPLPPRIVRLLETASRHVSSCGLAPAPAADAPADPLSLHCWLVERALHHSAFADRGLQEALRRLRHRLPPRAYYRRVSRTHTHAHSAIGASRLRDFFGGAQSTDRSPMGYRRRTSRTHAHKWRCAPPAPPLPLAPPCPRGKSHSYPPFPPADPPRPPDDYSSLDALCLQMTEQAID